MSLRETFDNVTHSSDKWEPYFEIYEKHLQHLKGKDIHLVEVGVQKGGSLEMWSNWLGPQAKITGIDVDEACRELKYDQQNITVMIGDQGSRDFWKQVEPILGNIDVFIDDGGHTMEQQIVTFEAIFPKLKVGSIFICEDTHTSYMSHHGGGIKAPNTFIEYSKDFVDVLHQNWWQQVTTKMEEKRILAKDLTGIFFYDSVVVFEKFGKRRMQRVAPRKFKLY